MVEVICDVCGKVIDPSRDRVRLTAETGYTSQGNILAWSADLRVGKPWWCRS